MSESQELERLEAQNAQLRVQLQRCLGVFHTLQHGTEKELDELFDNAERLSKETRIDPEAGLAMLSERRELRERLERERQLVEQLSAELSVERAKILKAQDELDKADPLDLEHVLSLHKGDLAAYYEHAVKQIRAASEALGVWKTSDEDIG